MVLAEDNLEPTKAKVGPFVLANPEATARAAYTLLERAPQASAGLRAPAPSVASRLLATLVFIGGVFGLPPVAALVFLLGLLIGCLGFALRLIAILLAPWPRPPLFRPKITPVKDEDLPTISVLVPMYREALAAPHLIEAVLALDYPAERLEVLILLEQDDVETQTVLASRGLPPNVSVVIAPDIGPKTKPKVLNLGLGLARGTIVGVYDAEDRPASEQLRAVAAAFARAAPNIACVQAPLYVFNRTESWVAAQFAFEYAAHFGLMVPFARAIGWPVLLGGTSNFLKRDALEHVGGWDAFNVTEDADLGLRLAAFGYRTTTIRAPTWEEAPLTMGALIRQRSRWIKGFMQTWAVLSRQRTQLLARTGLWAFVGAHVQLGLSIAAAFAHLPLLAITLLAITVSGLTGPRLWLLGFAIWPVALALLTGLRLDLVRAGYRKRAPLWTLREALTAPLYWPLQTLAAVRALYSLWFAPSYWAKTDHGRTRQDALPEATHNH